MSEDDPVSAELDDSEEIAAEIDDDDEATVDVGQEEAAEAFNFTGPARPPRARPAAKPKDPEKSLKATAVPILATVGLLMVGLTGWAALILLNSHVWLWDRPNAKIMAGVMLMCGPIAAALFAGSVVFFKQIQREKVAYQQAIAATTKPKKPAPKPLKTATPKPRPR